MGRLLAVIPQERLSSAEGGDFIVTLLVVEDDASIRRLISVYLGQEGYRVVEAADGEEALRLLDKQPVDLVISDIMMPKMDGYALTETLRGAKWTVPVLLITAKEGLEPMEQGFRVGTDDYLVKPIRMKELSLRVSALLRRAKIASEREITTGDVTLSYDALTVITERGKIELPKKEFYLLFHLLSYPSKIFSRQQLLDAIWGYDAEVDARTVDSHVKKLRKRLENVKSIEIVTIRGLGYKAEVRAE